MSTNNHPHEGQPVARAGASLENAKAAMVMVHGRGANAESILTLADEFKEAGFAYLAPQANGFTWYPQSFLAPIEVNEPGISSGIRVINDLVLEIEQGGIPMEKIMLLGFSQGACLSLESAARHPRRYGGVAGLSGGLIGPDGTARNYPGSLEGTPVFLGCSDVDMHIPVERVHHTNDILQNMNAVVDERIYPGMGHTINENEIGAVKSMMQKVLALI